MTPEGKVKKEIKEVLHKWKILPTALAASATEPINGWYYMPVPSGYGEAGIPDFVCCIKGIFIGVEAKTPKGKQTGRQKLVEKAIMMAAGKYFAVHSGGEMDLISGILITGSYR